MAIQDRGLRIAWSLVSFTPEKRGMEKSMGMSFFAPCPLTGGLPVHYGEGMRQKKTSPYSHEGFFSSITL